MSGLTDALIELAADLEMVQPVSIGDVGYVLTAAARIEELEGAMRRVHDPTPEDYEVWRSLWRERDDSPATTPPPDDTP